MEIFEDSMPSTSSAFAENADIAHETLSNQDVTVAKSEKLDRHGPVDHPEDPPSKRIKPAPTETETEHVQVAGLGSSAQPEEGLPRRERQKGVAPIKAEWVFSQSYCYWSAYYREGFLCANWIVEREQMLQSQVKL